MSPRLRDLLLLVAIVVAGFALRVRDLPAHRPSPDEGNYMHSARLNVIGREGGLGRWAEQDLRWARECVRDFSRAENKTTYPHSYLEQWTMRWAYRLGASCLTSVRLSSALLGALLSIALYAAARWMRLGSAAALSAAALSALTVVFAWYSRAGWGQMGCTTFYALYLGLAYRLFDPAAEHDRRAYLGLGLGLGLTGLFAYGWHEMIVVHVGWMGIFAGLVPLAAARASGGEGAARGYLARLLRSPRTWTLVASALPILLLLLALFFLNPWTEVWFGEPENLNPDRMSRWERYRLALGFLFRLTRVQEQITYPVLALALVGAVTLARRRRFLFGFLAFSLVGSALPFFLLYNLPHLVRVYLPTLAIVVLFAGQGFATIAELAAGKGRSWIAWTLGVGLFGYLGATTWQTLYAPLDAPLAVRRFDPIELRGIDPRWSMRPILERLDQELEPGETVGCHQSFEPLFRVLDTGHPAAMFRFRTPVEGEPPQELPRFVIGLGPSFEGAQNANFGEQHPYELVVRETAGRFGLYRRR